MRKILSLSILAVFVFASCAFADVNPDSEIHKVIGGLYSLVSAIAVNGEAAPDIRVLRRCFNDAPNGWAESIRVERVNDEIWAGVAVERYSTARKFLRSKAPELGITDTPAGSAWMGGDFAWIKAGNISKGKLTPSPLKAAQSEGTIFFSTEGQEDWWVSYPSLSKKSSQEVMKLWGVKAAGLHRPESSEKRVSIYDEVRPSEVRKPDEMHTNRKHRFGESYDIEMGDVIFKPVPSTRYRD